MFRILSIDGGGVRGIFPAYFLKLLQDQVPNSPLGRHFDLIVGTSTGSIIAAAIACDIPMTDLVKLYEEYAARIFGQPRITLLGTLRSKYDATPLVTLANKLFGERKMSDVPRPLVIPSTDISNGNVFVIKSSYRDDFVRDRDTRLAEAVVASCAAPLYFDPRPVKEYLLSDGGVWANNPSLVAYTEAVGKLGQPADAVRLLSLGTGTGNQYYQINSPGRRWGFATGWKHLQLVNLFLTLQSRAAHNSVFLLLGNERYRRVSFEQTGALPLDDATTLPSLKAKAAQEFTYQSKQVRELLAI